MNQIFICHICEEKFEQNAFETHFPTCAKQKPDYILQQDHKCDSCGKKFSQIASLKRHIYTCTEEKPKCQMCYKSFSSSKDFKKHVLKFHKTEKKVSKKKFDNICKNISLLYLAVDVTLFWFLQSLISFQR